ncbi:SIS domain-containing protein [Ferruginibacter sp. HRS2-29]|uniref:D-sedoheptulose-7-phosphate isomerase n=1 Tax=Ferruginibacter sp. HRS2-29 TaxID=2487334 RepID=UPI0020CDC9BE|nr:D-sedoheptulose 7-phosphate isomerase [Ferruginibacter sp. HRS2-29]MCP9750358.1 SIS domain-containing protein [Ferruginibacter sp. HRS2-29]
MLNTIKSLVQASIDTKQQVLENEELLATVQKCVNDITTAFRNGKKVLFCGNGGSAADAQHLAAEFSGRFYLDRDALPAEALHVNSSYMTAVANDYSYDVVYARMVKGFGHEGDVLVAISTSGNSKNIIQAVDAANEKGMLTIGFTGATGGKMKDICDHLINIPSTDTPRIQESHILIGHIICQLVEDEYFNKHISQTGSL